jgi:hypothetical protein
MTHHVLRRSQCGSVGFVDTRLDWGGYRRADRHAPRKRGIQYAEILRFITDVSEYWIIRLRG